MLRLRLWPKCSDEQADSDAGNNRREKRGARMAADTLFNVLNIIFDDAVRLFRDVIRFNHNAQWVVRTMQRPLYVGIVPFEDSACIGFVRTQSAPPAQTWAP